MTIWYNSFIHNNLQLNLITIRFIQKYIPNHVNVIRISLTNYNKELIYKSSSSSVKVVVGAGCWNYVLVYCSCVI